MNPLVHCGDRYSLETEARRHQQSASLGNGSLLCRVLGKYILYADVEDVAITPHLCLDGFWESWITFVVLRIVQAGWCCIDVGANFGYYPLLFGLETGGRTRTIAFEPDPVNVERLRRNVALNPGVNVTVVPMAVGDKDDATVGFDSAPAGHHVWSRLVEVNGGDERVYPRCPRDRPEPVRFRVRSYRPR